MRGYDLFHAHELKLPKGVRLKFYDFFIIFSLLHKIYFPRK